MSGAPVSTVGSDSESRSDRYFRNAVERHWDPVSIDLQRDLSYLLAREHRIRDEPTVGPDDGPVTVSLLRNLVAMFGAGETEVAEDLSPLVYVLEDPMDRRFVTTQIYEESKHVEFFDRYWREVVQPLEDELGLPRTEPTDDRWHPQGYLTILGQNSRAMNRLLEADTPENRAKAYCHYHLMVEAFLAQGGYYMLTNAFGGKASDMPFLPGLIEGIGHIRADEGRHVGFGVEKVRNLVASRAVSPDLVERTVGRLIRTLVIGGPITESTYPRSLLYLSRRDIGFGAADPVTHLLEKHLGRMDMIRDAAGDIPEADRLTSVDTGADRLRNLAPTPRNIGRSRRMLRAITGI